MQVSFLLLLVCGSYREVSCDGVLVVKVLIGLSSGVWSELARVFMELRVSDIDIKTLSKTELGSESMSRRCRYLWTSSNCSSNCSSSL